MSNKKLEKLGWAALSVGVTTLITFGVKAIMTFCTDKSKTNIQTKAAEKLEMIRTQELIKRYEAKEKHHHKMAEIDIKKKKMMKEVSNKLDAADNADEFDSPYVSKLASFKDSLENDTRELEWLVGKKIEVGGRCLLYGTSGIGKSYLSLQTAIAIAGGTDYGFLPPEEENPHEAQQVILIDLEMNAAEQKERTRGITIPENLLRNTEPIYNLDELFRMIENESHAPKVTVIIDNIRKLEEEMSQTYQVNEYFSKLEQTQEKLAAKGIIVTFITITHTGKEFDIFKPAQLSDVTGGADLARFSTSVYALVPGRDGKIVFKAVKQRNSARMEDVYLLRFEENPNVHLQFVCSCKEEDALPVKPKKPKGGKAGSSSKSDKAAEKPKKRGNATLTAKHVEQIRQQRAAGVKWNEIMLDPDVTISVRTMQRALHNHQGEDKRA